MNPTTSKISTKPYECTKCGHEFEAATNHWGCIYAAPCCGYGVAANCTEPAPEGIALPEKWGNVTLGDIATITEVKL